ncbi:MAG: D-Ala-D-Ala carboxypeptidase family metallohydrolase, partial [Rhizobacter sp.]|nr:D-Ala-D-Ala carboxypeptidase family metallohydrolase [Rhizobacter sp.]
MHLSRFFTLDELTHSNTAKAEGINNQPTATEVECLRALCGAVLDPLREAMGNAIKVNSGYRGPALNRRLKGA